MKKLVQFLTQDVWRIRVDSEPKSRRLWLKPLRVILMAVQGFANDQCTLRASALTFYSLLSFVPVLALAFGVAKGFGMHELFEEKLRDLAGGGSVVQVESNESASDEQAQEAADEEEDERVSDLTEGQAKVVDQAISFSSKMLDNAKGGIVAGFGIIILLWTVIKLLSHIEQSFNAIWHVRKGRGWTRKFSDYLSVMLIAPVLFLISTSLTAFLASRFLGVVEGVSWLAFLGGLARLLLIPVPTILFALLFTFLYMLMPHTRVKIVSALLGGFVASLLYQITQYVFVQFQVGISSANAIYGTFAALPLFLTWLQLSWMIVLLGAEFAYAHQYSDMKIFDQDQRPISPRLKRLAALNLVRESIKDFAEARPAPTAEELSCRVGLPIRVTSAILAELVDCGVLSQVLKKKSGTGFQPALDINKIDLAKVVLKLDAHGREDYQITGDEERHLLEEKLNSIKQYIESPEINVPL